jgi:hypothetical protein
MLITMQIKLMQSTLQFQLAALPVMIYVVFYNLPAIGVKLLIAGNHVLKGLCNVARRSPGHCHAQARLNAAVFPAR